MKKHLLTFLVFLFSITAIFSVCADEQYDRIILTPEYLYSTYSEANGLIPSLCNENGIDYVRYDAYPGSYTNNQLMISISHQDVIVCELPYIAIGYKTNSIKSNVDIGMRSSKGENWMTYTPKQINDGSWQTLYIDVNEIIGNGTNRFPASDETNVRITLKPWGSHDKTIHSIQHYDISYIGFFSNEEAAKDFVFDPTVDYTQPSDIAPENCTYIKADSAVITEYLEKVNNLKLDIINSKTNVKYTGKAYYVSPNGNDNNDGLSPQTAFKTPSKVSGADFLTSGDAVFFERDAQFRLDYTFKTVSGVAYSAYGEGNKPKFIGSYDASAPSNWRKTDAPNVYALNKSFDKNQDIGQIIFDLGKAWGIKLQNGIFIGENSNGNEMITTAMALVDGPEDLDGDLEYWHDWETNTLYLCSKHGNPGARFGSIEIAPLLTGISGKGSNVTLDNIELFGYGSHGISFGGIGENTTTNLTVQNCTLSFIGGSRFIVGADNNTRLGNAVQIYGAGKDITFKNNYAHNIYDCCFTIQYQDNSNGVDVMFENVEISGNISEYSNTGIEIWLVKPNGNEATYSLSNVRAHHNHILYSGYGWSAQRPTKDANIFYGDTQTSNTTFENCSIDNNTGFLTAKYITLARYVSDDKYNLHNNTYFQHNSKHYGSSLEVGVGEFSYNGKMLENLSELGVEKDSVFYFVKNDDYIKQYSPSILSFDDVPKDHWAYQSIENALVKGYFEGISKFEFAPSGTLSRAMLATVLSRIENSNIAVKQAPYTDVSSNAWYLPGINYVYSAELVDANITKFRPDENVTREELSDMLYRFVLTHNRIPLSDFQENDFTDLESVSDQYKDGVLFALNHGIITGYEDKTIRPKNSATRAEVAVMIKRFVSVYYSLDIDFNKLSNKTDFHVYSGEDLSKIIATSPGDKRIINGTLNIIPNDTTLSVDKYPKALIFSRISKLLFEHYPYVKIRLKTSGKSTGLGLTFTKGDYSSTINLPVNSGNYSTVNVCLYDLIAPGTVYDGEYNGVITLSPWANSEPPTYNLDTCEIDYIGFFPTSHAAKEYESENEKNSEYILFTSDNTELSVQDYLKSSVNTDDGISYIRFQSYTNTTATDNTRGFIKFSDQAYDIKQLPVMKIVCRTNIESCSNFQINAYPKENVRIWEKNIKYENKNKWCEAIIDLSKVEWSGGVNVEKGLTGEQYFDIYFNGPLYQILIKPYPTIGASVKNSEYFDISYIGLFKTTDAAEAFQLIR